MSWHVAVKTGTAQVQAPAGPEQTDDWMIGFMPAVGAPQMAIAVVVPDQSFTGDRRGRGRPHRQEVFQAYLDRDRRPVTITFSMPAHIARSRTAQARSVGSGRHGTG